MITVHVTLNAKGLTNLESKFMRALATGLKALAIGAHREWSQAAASKLYTTRRQYQMALAPPVPINEFTYEIVLRHPDNKINWLVTALEVGYGKIDMKRALLAPAVKGSRRWSQYHKTKPGQKKIGAPFLDVPFKAGQSDKPMFFRRVSPRSAGWMHMGFRPIGQGGLAEPLRETAKRFLRDNTAEVLKPIFERIK